MKNLLKKKLVKVLSQRIIITIVVIIILATAIIVNLAQTNIINNANEAVVKQDFKTMQEELELYIADKYTDTLGEFDVTTLDATEKDEVATYIPSITKTKYADYVTIEDGQIVISDSMPEPQKTWAMETLNSTKTSTNTPTESEETDTPVFTSTTTVATENSTYTGEDFAYNNPVIPAGFKILNDGVTWTDTDNDGVVDSWNDGLVIVDGSGNEFVWVPCTLDGANGTVTYTKRFDEYPKYKDITSVSDDTDALPTVNDTTIDETYQINIYGGFYIGRYEAGVPANQTTIDGTYGDGSTSKSDVEGTPVVQRGATVWTYISYNKAIPNAEKLYESSTSVRSGLVTGTGWDTVCAWIQSEKDSERSILHSVTNSVSWGNYSDTSGSAQYDTDETTKISGTKQTAGYSEYWKAKNIYDIAGNTWEWTGEIYSTDRVYRGGFYFDSGSTIPASYRSISNPSGTYGNMSFRLVLYVM